MESSLAGLPYAPRACEVGPLRCEGTPAEAGGWVVPAGGSTVAAGSCLGDVDGGRGMCSRPARLGGQAGSSRTGVPQVWLRRAEVLASLL